MRIACNNLANRAMDSQIETRKRNREGRKRGID